jgi:hypothetical protein
MTTEPQLRVILLNPVKAFPSHTRGPLVEAVNFMNRGELLMEESLARGIVDLWRFIPAADLAATTEE